MIAKLAVGFVAGVALGGLFFSALWLTVRRVPTASAPVVLTAGSYLLRVAAMGAGLYVVVRIGGGAALLTALVGILTARQLVIRRIAAARGDGGVGSSPDQEGAGTPPRIDPGTPLPEGEA